MANKYRFIFTNAIDYYTIQFVNPPLTDLINNNFDKVSATEYVFHQINTDSSGKYTSNPTGSPVIVLKINLTETTQLFTDLQNPTNRDQIVIPNFLTVMQVNDANVQDPNVSTASIDLQIKNILPL